MVAIVHVPAWKKLGLKLKYAKDIPIEGYEGFKSENIKASVAKDGDAGQASESLGLKLKKVNGAPPDDGRSTVSKPNKRKRELSKNAEDPVSPLSKKHKKSQAAALKAIIGGEIESPAALRETPAASNISSAPSPTKQKSVSFTPETKTKDGDSIKQLYNAWLAEQTDGFNPRISAEALRPVSSLLAGETKKPSKVKKAKKRKASKSTLFPCSVVLQTTEHITTADNKELSNSKKAKHREVLRSTLSPPSAESGAAIQASKPAYIPPYLQYLNEYHISRSTWKFNKAKQTTLLKHVFDPVTIPLTYDLALQTYLSGLKGLAARARLRETALDILKLNQEHSNPDSKMDDEERAERDARVAEIFKFDPERALQRKRHQEEDYQYAKAFHVKKLKGIQACREEFEKEEDPAWKLTWMKRKRADYVLSLIPSTLGNADNPIALDDEVEDAAGTTGRKKKRSRVPSHMRRARQRKRRTGVPDDDSSSGDTTSSDEDAPNAPEASSSGKPVEDTDDSMSGSGLSPEPTSSSEDSGSDNSDAEDASLEEEGSWGEDAAEGAEDGLEPAGVGEEMEDEEDEAVAGPAFAAGAAAAEAASSPKLPSSSPEKDRSSDEDYGAPASRSKKGKGKAKAGVRRK